MTDNNDVDIFAERLKNVIEERENIIKKFKEILNQEEYKKSKYLEDQMKEETQIVQIVDDLISELQHSNKIERLCLNRRLMSYYCEKRNNIPIKKRYDIFGHVVDKKGQRIYTKMAVKEHGQPYSCVCS